MHIREKPHVHNKPLRVASLNIRRGLNNKEEMLKNLIYSLNCDIIGIGEVDIEGFCEDKPFSIHDYKTFYPPQRPGSTVKRLICMVKQDLEVKQRNDLMSNQFSSVWLEIKGPNQKILICTLYREFSDRNGQGRFLRQLVSF